MHRIGFLLMDGFQVMALATLSRIRVRQHGGGEPFYAIDNYSVAGGPVRSSLGMHVETCGRPRARRWIRGSSSAWGTRSPRRRRRRIWTSCAARRRARRAASICTGAFVLAEAGPARRPAHHALGVRAGDAAAAPGIRVEDDRIYIVDGPIWTSAGMTAGFDLALAMVEKDLGADAARSLAHKLVMVQRRAGGQSQHSELLDMAPKSDRIQRAIDHARKHLSQPLDGGGTRAVGAPEPAPVQPDLHGGDRARSPAKAIESLRLEAARLMIEPSRHPLDVVARGNRLPGPPAHARGLVRGFGLPPPAVRRAARA